MRLDARDAGFRARLRGASRRQARGLRGCRRRRSAAIIADVVARGDAALIDYTRRFDRLDADAASACASRRRDRRRGRAHARREALDALGARAGAHRGLPPRAAARRTTLRPMRSASSSAGAGRRSNRSGSTCRAARASYPSSVLMNAVPAKVAGVPRVVMVVPTPRRRAQPAGAGRRAPRRRRRDLPRSAARRRSRRWPMARRRSRRSPRSSGPATPMSPPPSAGCSARSAST